jgi:hypothetical protein
MPLLEAKLHCLWISSQGLIAFVALTSKIAQALCVAYYPTMASTDEFVTPTKDSKTNKDGVAADIGATPLSKLLAAYTRTVSYT